MKEAMDAGAVLCASFPSGHTWSIRFSSAPGIYHALSEPNGDQISLGYDDPHFHLPILRWAEAWRIAACLGQHPGGIPVGFVLPLLAPLTWATSPDEAAEAERQLAEAWTATGMVDPGHADALANRLVLCVPDLVWRPDPVHGWINNGRHSHRNPAVGFWTPDSFAVFRRFLNGFDADRPPAISATADDGPALPVTAVWRFDWGEPVEPTVTVSGGRVYCFTTGSKGAKVRALDAATGQQRWYGNVVSRGFGRNAVTVADGMVFYAGGLGDIDLVAFREDASGESDVVWTHSVEGGEGHYGPSGAYCGWADTTPVVADGRVFVIGDNLYARLLTSFGPQPGWDGYLPGVGTTRRRPVVVGDRVYVVVGESFRDGSTVRAFDAATGERVGEEIEVAGVPQDLVCHDAELFVAAGALAVFDAATGAARWSVTTERQWVGAIGVSDNWVVGATCRLLSPSPAGDPELRYTIVGVDRRRREVAWTFSPPGPLHSSGVVVDGEVAYSVGYDDHAATLYAVDVSTGALRWQYSLGRSTCLPAVADGTVYVSAADALLALRCSPGG